jgi:phage pi2 protein 07
MMMELMELGAAAYVARMIPGKDLISQREAYREFGEARVKEWSSMLSKKRAGIASRSKILYSRSELLALDKGEKHVKIINKNNYKINNLKTKLS